MGSHYERDQKKVTVHQLLLDGKSRSEISELTGIHIRVVDKMIKEIHSTDKERWSEVANESVENRAILIKEKYEKIAKKAEIIVDKPDCTAKELDIAGKLLIACQLNIYEMLKNGPLRFTQVIKAKELEVKDE